MNEKDTIPYPFQRSEFYSVRFFRRGVSFPFLGCRRGRSWSSRFLFRGLHTLYFALSHVSFLFFLVGAILRRELRMEVGSGVAVVSVCLKASF